MQGFLYEKGAVLDRPCLSLIQIYYFFPPKASIVKMAKDKC